MHYFIYNTIYKKQPIYLFNCIYFRECLSQEDEKNKGAQGLLRQNNRVDKESYPLLSNFNPMFLFRDIFYILSAE